MAKIIVKCSYLKGTRHRSFYTKYMATREGAEKINVSYGRSDATAKQKEMITQLLKDFPDAEKLFEYEDYLQNPNRENASELISCIMENNLETAATKENYVDYIASRPGAEKLGEHGLFSDTDEPINLNETAKRVAEHDGIVWTNIISIRREDAVRFGYDNAKAWMNMCRAKRNEFAEAMQISPDKLKWYAAFHNEGHHPHIHMIVYAEDGKQGYLTKKGIEQLRSMYAGTIFRQELYQLYEDKSEKRDEIKKVSRERIKELLASLQQSIQENEQIVQKVQALYARIQDHKGRLVYGYLKKEDKALVDEIVCLLEKDERIQELYDAWHQIRQDISSVYKDETEMKIPLHMQKEFKSIRNIILQEVSKVDPNASEDDEAEFQDASEEDADEPVQMEYDEMQEEGFRSPSYIMEWSETYREAMSLIYCQEEEQDMEKAMDHLRYEAGRGNVLALCELAKIHQKGIGLESDKEKAEVFYSSALEGFYELYRSEGRKKEYIAYRIGKFHLYGLGTEQNYEKAVKYFTQAKENKYALYSLGMMAKRGLGMEQDEEAAFRYFCESAGKGNAYAQYEAARAMEDGRRTDRNTEQADRYYRSAFFGFMQMEEKSGDDNLQYRLGRMCYEGKGTEKDVEKAEEYLGRSFRMKNEHAGLLLAKIWLKENCFEHFQDAETILEELAEKENEPAMFLLGKEYASGEHLEKDMEQAIAYLKKCSDKGNPYADYRLYRIYRDELPDVSEMLHYLKLSAERGNDSAQMQLGKLYAEGGYLKKDIDSALFYLGRSAEQSNMYAQYLLGRLFLFGRDVQKDEELAVQYLQASAEQGNEYAEWLLEHKDDFQKQPMALLVSRFFHHAGRIFEKQLLPPSDNPLLGTDRKLKRKLMMKRAALGHKEDDHTMNQGR